MMYQKIMVPLDGSRFAEAALPYAVGLARAAGARLHLVLAHEPVAAMIGMGEGIVPVELDDEARHREETYLADTVGGLLEAGTVPVDWRELEGQAGPAISDEVSRSGADLVVMSTHGRGALGRLWLGSVADHLIRHLGVPILLVRPGKGGEAAKGDKLHSVLVALDLSQDAEAILEPVIALTHITQGHVTLGHILEPILGFINPALPYPEPISPEVLERHRTGAQHRLDLLADRLREKGISVNTRVWEAGSAAVGLLTAMEDGRYDMIAMTTHGRGGFRRVVLGSVADKVVRGAAKPVLVMRPPAATSKPAKP